MISTSLFYIEFVRAAHRALSALLWKKSPSPRYVFSVSKSTNAARRARKKKTLKGHFGGYAVFCSWQDKTALRLRTKGQPLVIEQSNNFPRALFHIKCLFDVNEFVAYDLFNFYRSTTPANQRTQSYVTGWSPSKINFFYRIRSSINVFRLHTLKFFHVSYRTEHRANLFFKAFARFNAMSYLWFFEFNVAVFLVKLNFALSVKHAHLLIHQGLCIVNNRTITNYWSTITPSDFIRIPLGLTTLAWFRAEMAHKLMLPKKYNRFIEKLFFKKRIPSVKVGKKKQALNKAYDKSRVFKYIEVDVKTLTAALLPYKDNFVYLRLVFTLWLNYWNFRVALWKYRT